MEFTEIKGKHIGSVPVYLMRHKKSFMYRADKDSIILNSTNEKAKELLNSFGFETNEFEYATINPQ